MYTCIYTWHRLIQCTCTCIYYTLVMCIIIGLCDALNYCRCGLTANNLKLCIHVVDTYSY